MASPLEGARAVAELSTGNVIGMSVSVASHLRFQLNLTI